MTKSEFEKAVQKNMTSLGISREEAEELVKYDNEEIENEEAEALTQKAKKNIRTQVSTGTRKVKTVKERKVDEDKAHLIDKLMHGLDGITTIDSVKNEAEFCFNFNGANYTVKLVKHR